MSIKEVMDLKWKLRPFEIDIIIEN